MPTWLRAHHFGFSNYDFGIYSQGLARLALDPPNPWLSGRQIFLFNDHFDPILFLGVPFARLFPAASVGLIIEALSGVIALGALWWLAANQRLSTRAHWTLSVLLALHVGVSQAMGFPFHPTTWAMAPMAWLLAALILERWRVALVVLVLLFACKEEFPFVGIALIPFVWSRAPRRVAATWAAISALWGLFAFVLRPMLFGDVMPYASQPFRSTWSERFAPGVLAGAGDLVVAFVPLIIWLLISKARSRPALLLSFALLPMLGIRFLSMAWRDHYGAVVAAAAVLVLAAWMEARTPAWWAIALTFGLVLLTDESLLRRDFKSVSGAQGWGASSGCDDVDGRRAAVAAAIELARKAPGPLLVSGNLVPWLGERSDVYAFGGPQGDGFSGGTWLLEQPACGDTWAIPREERERLAALARSRRVLVDDGFVIVSSAVP
ncbi:MAG: DUF2079 domain-containing protein [Archangium sp.]